MKTFRPILPKPINSGSELLPVCNLPTFSGATFPMVPVLVQGSVRNAQENMLISSPNVVSDFQRGPELTPVVSPLKDSVVCESQEPSSVNETVNEVKMFETEAGTLKCLCCNEYFGSKEDLQEHSRCHADQKVYSKGTLGTEEDKKECGKNKKKSRRKSYVSLHSRKADEPQIELPPVVMPVNEAAVPEDPAADSQTSPDEKTSKTEMGTGSHKCVLCNQCLGTKEDLQEHFRRHANQEIDIKGKPRSKQVNGECDAIKKKSVKKTNVSVEVESSDTGNAVCDVCGEEFRTVSLAISHKFRKHPNSAVKYYCPHCGMMFPIKVNRDNHIKTHSSVIPKEVYPCLTCNVSFFNLKALKFHVDSAHKGSTRLVSPVDTPAPSLKIVLNNAGEPCSIYYCHLCGCEYQVKYNLQRHLETKHSEIERLSVPEQVIQCNLCKALFCSKRAYEAHNHHHRSSDLYATDEIVRQSLIQRKDQDFDYRRVPSVIERYLSASAVNSNRAATWRNIRAAKQKEGAAVSCPKTKPTEARELCINIDSKFPPVSCADSTRSDHLNSGNALSQSNLSIDRTDILADSDNSKEDKFIHGENMCWGAESKTVGKKRVLDDSEEDDCDIRSLGLVNPDTVLANPRLICDNPLEDVSVLSSSSNTLHEALKEEEDLSISDKGSSEGKIKCRAVSSEKSDLRFEDDNEADCSGLVVEKILAMRRRSKGREFLVRWKGFEPADDTWEKEEMLHCVELIVDFLQNRSKREKTDVEWYAAKKRKKTRVKSSHQE